MSVNLKLHERSRDRLLGAATGYWLDGRGIEVRSLSEERSFSLLHSVQTGFGVDPASYQRLLGPLSSGVKGPGHESDRSPSSAESKNDGVRPQLSHTSS
jgi:hypothetical protein